MDWKNTLGNAQRTVANTYGGVQNNLLDRLGLEPKRTTMELILPALGVFGLGIAAGAALGVMFAPKRGEELRTNIKHRISDIRERGVEQLDGVRAKGEELIESARELTHSAIEEA